MECAVTMGPLQCPSFNWVSGCACLPGDGALAVPPSSLLASLSSKWLSCPKETGAEAEGFLLMHGLLGEGGVRLSCPSCTFGQQTAVCQLCPMTSVPQMCPAFVIPHKDICISGRMLLTALMWFQWFLEVNTPTITYSVPLPNPHIKISPRKSWTEPKKLYLS